LIRVLGLISLLLLGLNLGSNEEAKSGECSDLGRNSVVALQILEYINRDRVKVYCNGLVEELDIDFDLIPVIGETYLVTVEGGQIVDLQDQPGVPILEDIKVLREVECMKLEEGRYLCNGRVLRATYLPRHLEEVTYYEDGEVASWR